MDEAEKRTSIYDKENKGCLNYHGVKDIFGEIKWQL